MTESLGTARLDIVVGTEQFDAAITQAQTRISGMSSAAQAEYAKLSAAEKRRVDSLIKQADQLGKTRQEQILYNAALKGTPTHILDELKNKLAGTVKPAADMAAKIRESGKAAADASKQLNQYGISAKQQAAALRGVPAQLTDIFTSLASGQRPITVLLQQGGQLKDMFGGIVPAARALGGQIASMVTPLTVAAGAVLGLAYAWNEAEQRAVAFNRALDITGNIAGTTADELADMAARLDDSTGATAGKASSVLAQVAATGKFTRDELERVASAAIQMESATGRAIDQTIKDFASLKDDPLDAILKLNDAIGDGTNVVKFLTPETSKLIQKLEEQGDRAGAARVAMDALFDTISERAPKAIDDVGLMEGAWRGLKKGVSETFDEIVNGFGEADRAAKQGIDRFGQYLRALQQSGPASMFAFQQVSAVPSVTPSAPKAPAIVDGKAEREAIAFKDRYLTREESKKKAIAELDRLKSHYTAEEYKILKAGIEERFKPPKGARDPSAGIESATSRAAIQALEDQLKKEQGLLSNQRQLLEANYTARNILATDYYKEQKRLAQENTDAQVRALEGEIAALQSRSLKGKDSINNARELAEKEALLAKVRADGATALEVLNIQEAAQIKQRQQANIAYQDALDQGREALKAELDSQVLRISVGEREFEIRSRIIQLYRDEAKELLNLARQRDAGEIDPETYKQRVEQLKKAIGEEVQIVRDGYAEMAKAQQNWSNGALKAFADYRDAANDVAGQTYSIFTNALGGLEDVLTDFFTKGKADWKGFFDGIAEEITRFVIRQQLSKLVAKFFPGQDKDNAGALTAAAGSLAASAAPLMGAAAALSASAAALAAAGVGNAAGGSDTSSGGSSASWLSLIWSFLANANGNAFNGGQVMAFANGGVVGSPTLFGMRDGIGLMGEAGPEAIMPLSRGPDGRLGIATGSSAANITVHIATPDADSFRRSEAYLTGQIARAVARGQRSL